MSYRTVTRRLPGYAKASWRAAGRGLCRPAGLGPASLVLYDVSTLYFETDAGDGFREPGFSKERRLEPQITIGLLTDATGFPLMVEAFEGNKAETKTMLPMITAFMAAHQLRRRDRGRRRRDGLGGQPAGDRGRRACRSSSAPASPRCPTWSPNGAPSTPARRSRTGTCSPSRGRPTDRREGRGHPDRSIYYQYRARPGPAHAARDRRAGRQGREGRRREGPVKRNRFIKLAGADKSVNRDLEAKARALAGIKGYVTNLDQPDRGVRDRRLPPLWRIEKASGCPSTTCRPADLPPQTRVDRGAPDHRVRRARGRPLDRETAPAGRSSSSCKPPAATAPSIRAGYQTLTAADPLPDDIQDVLATITTAAEAPSDSGRSDTAAEGTH